MPTDLRLRATWRIDAEPAAVQAVLGDVVSYPGWWSSVASAEVEGSGYALAVRGPSATALRVQVTGIDASDGVLAARLRGDVLGWCSWHVAPAPEGGSCIVMQQHVLLQRRSLRVLARVAPGRLRASHAALMRAGEAGLRALLVR